MRRIFVTPLDSGWLVRQDGGDPGLVFRTGARAEAAARRLARAFADTGASAEILVYLRDGSLGGRIVSTAVRAAQARVAG